MRKGMKSIIVLLINLIFITCVKPNDLRQLINKQNDTLINKLQTKIVKENIFDLEKLTIKAYPAFNVDIINLKDGKTDLNLSLNKELNFFIIKYDSINYFLQNYWFELKGTKFKKWLTLDSPYKKAVELAENKSKYVFFLYLDNNPVIGFIKKDSIKYITSELTVFKSLQSLIKYRIGSYERYKNNVERKNYEKHYLDNVRTFEDAKKYYKYFPYNFIRYNIFDTTSLTKAILFEIEEFGDITDYQKKKLTNDLIEKIKSLGFGLKDFNNLSTIDLVLYTESFKEVIDGTIKDNLTFNQYVVYLSNKELFNNLLRKSDEIIFNYYKNEQNINNDSLIRQTIIKEIFKQ